MNRIVKIGPYEVGEGLRPVVIAEAGINHNGDLNIAREMVRVAKKTGADIVKFQTHIAQAEMLAGDGISSEAGSHVTRSLFDIMTESALTLEEHLELKKEAERLGILFLSTPFSIEAVELLEKAGVLAYKIGSGEVTNLPFLKYVAKKGKPIILSTGTANWKEVVTAVNTIKEYNSDLILMQCTSNYPTPYENVNLGVIEKMMREFKIPVGLSDHCPGNYACFGAVAMGACIVEKHFTISRLLPGIDQNSSVEPRELEELVTGVRAIFLALGNKKELNPEALKVRHGFSESIVTIRDIKLGEEFKERINIWVKRPGYGMPSYELSSVVGKYASRNLLKDYLLKSEDISDTLSILKQKKSKK